MKHILILLTFSFKLTVLTAQKTNDIIPAKNFTFNYFILSGNLAYEKKLNPSITIYSSVGLNGSAVGGSNGINGENYTEFSFLPAVNSQLRYYAFLNNTNASNKVNKVFAGTYFGIGLSIEANSISKPKYTDPRGGYGIGCSVGRQIQKFSGWNFGYFVGYTLFSGRFSGNSSNNSGFGIGGSIGYRLFSKD